MGRHRTELSGDGPRVRPSPDLFLTFADSLWSCFLRSAVLLSPSHSYRNLDAERTAHLVCSETWSAAGHMGGSGRRPAPGWAPPFFLSSLPGKDRLCWTHREICCPSPCPRDRVRRVPLSFHG